MSEKSFRTRVLDSPESNLSLSDRLTSFLNHRSLSPQLILLLSAFLIGAGAGLGIILFRWLIDLFQTLTFKNFLGIFSRWGFWTVALVPVLGGLLVGIMRLVFPLVLGENLATLISQEGTQKISFWRPLIKMSAGAVSLGTGASLGAESPSVELGASIGALFGQTFQVAGERYRLLLGAGAAAGLAAGFHTPIAGVFFALEVVLGTTFTSPALSIILLAAVVADIVSRFLSGSDSAFYIPEYHFSSPWECLFYIGLGLLASAVSLLYTEAIKIARKAFAGEIRGTEALGSLPTYLKPALGGFLVGIAALFNPEIMGIGYGTLASILAGREFTLIELFGLLSVKLSLTAISAGSGFVGGIFAPAMFLGGCLGALYANFLRGVLPIDWVVISPHPALAAMVGLAAVLAGSVKAPLTSLLILFELTGNYQVMLPVMISVGICTWVIELVKSYQSLEGLELQQMGIGVEQPHDLDILEKIPVSRIVDDKYLSLPPYLSLQEAGGTMLNSKCRAALVIDENRLFGIVTLADIDRHLDDTDRATIADICTKEILYTQPSNSLADALKQMTARGLSFLPVVAADDSRRVVGVLERQKIDLARELAETEIALSIANTRDLLEKTPG